MREERNWREEFLLNLDKVHRESKERLEAFWRRAWFLRVLTWPAFWVRWMYLSHIPSYWDRVMSRMIQLSASSSPASLWDRLLSPAFWLRSPLQGRVILWIEQNLILITVFYSVFISSAFYLVLYFIIATFL